MISQMHFLLLGYGFGKDGLVIVPLGDSSMPPQASERIGHFHALPQTFTVGHCRRLAYPRSAFRPSAVRIRFCTRIRRFRGC